MLKKILNKLIVFVALFLFFWFANNGFSTEPIFSVGQAALFALEVVILMFSRLQIKIWYWIIVILFILSVIFEAVQLPTLSEITGSTGFGMLTIFVIWSFVKMHKK